MREKCIIIIIIKILNILNILNILKIAPYLTARINRVTGLLSPEFF